MYRKNNNPIDNNNSNTIINSNSSNKSNQNKECTKKAINLINLNDEINNILLKQNYSIYDNIQNEHNPGTLTNEEKVFILNKQREKSSHCDRNKINKFKENSLNEVFMNNVQISNKHGNCQGNNKQSFNHSNVSNNNQSSIPLQHSKSKFNKSNNTSKHTNKNQIKMNFCIVQSSDNAHNAHTIQIENYEEFHKEHPIKQAKSEMNITSLNPNSKTALDQINNSLILENNKSNTDNTQHIINSNNASNKEKASSPNLRRYSKDILNIRGHGANSDLLQMIQKYSNTKYGEDKTNKLLLLINQLGNPKEVLSKDYFLKNVFGDKSLEAKEYFAQLFQ